jgi:hypothetical protein
MNPSSFSAYATKKTPKIIQTPVQPLDSVYLRMNQSGSIYNDGIRNINYNTAKIQPLVSKINPDILTTIFNNSQMNSYNMLIDQLNKLITDINSFLPSYDLDVQKEIIKDISTVFKTAQSIFDSFSNKTPPQYVIDNIIPLYGAISDLNSAMNTLLDFNKKVIF